MRIRSGTILCCYLSAAALTLGCIGDPAVRGIYSDPTGAFTLDFESGGHATAAFAGVTTMCTYKVEGNKIDLNCGADGTMVLTIQSDGSISGPPGTDMPPLRKK